MIIDSQVHVWRAETTDRPAKSAHLPQPFGYEDLLLQMRRANVDAAILIPPGWQGDTNDFALEGAQRYPKRFGVMGRIPIQTAGSAALLPTWKNQAGMLGIRVSFQKNDRKAWLSDGSADWFWPEAEKYDIPVMIFAPGKTAELRAIAINHPRLRMIVDHMGLAREKDQAAAHGIENLCALADCPNVHVKVSSVPLYSSEPYPYKNLHAPLRRLIGAFGPERCFWGTDLTRIWSLTTYAQLVTLFTEEFDFLSSDDLEWIMGRALARCVGWK